MRGLVLAAGAGRRLQPLTDDLPKTLLPVRGETSILELTVANLVASGLRDILVVTGFASHRIEALVEDIEARHDIRLQLVWNDKATVWNNAYSLWCAREFFDEGLLLCNGDTVHPLEMQRTLLAHRGPSVLLAIDTVKTLGEEEMKVRLDSAGRVVRINKSINPETAQGEYVGLTIIEPTAAGPLRQALEDTFRANPQLYYEDAYQLLADRGFPVDTAPIGELDWVEVDNHEDLARARDIACRY